MSERSRSFGRIAERYDDYRPSPPAGLAAYLGDVAGVPTLEVGAGTGKVTRFLLGLGARVVAVEPDPGMRAVLVARTPGVDVVDGVAE
ncbi:MAG: class I SAM-dependent methyltransferase, partial [Acidimicrobiales bacterium]